MSLNPSQKKYIKRHIRSENIDQIVESQKIEKQEILDFLEKRWGKEKLSSFLTKQINLASPPPKTNGFKSFIRTNLIYLLLLFILTMITYANSLSNAFLSDDIAEIVQNPNIGSFSNIAAHPFGFIRPVLYWLAFQIGGLNPFIFRSINILFHLGSVILCFAIFSRFSKRLAFFTAAIFAVHPAISEAVVWISGGSYPQYSFFFLLSFLFYILSKNSRKYYLASIVSFWFSFMSHPQMPLALFLVFPLWELSFGDIKKNWAKSIPYFLLSIAYVLVALGALPERETTLQTTHYQEKGIDNPFFLIIIAISSYLELIFFPSTLTLYHSELNFGQINFIIRVLVTIIFLAGAFLSYKKNKYIFFWLMFFLISLVPTLTPFRLNWIVAERYIYLPILGILGAVGLGFSKLANSKFKQLVYAVFAIIIVLLSGRTIIRNIDWQSEDNLWIATGKTSPSSPNNHNNLGDVYGRQGDKQASIREFQRAIELKPNYGDAYHNLANVYREIGQTDKAIENYQNAIKYNPGLWQSYQNIAAIYFEQKNYELAVENIQKAISINPRNPNLVNNLGVVYLLTGKKDQAKEIFNAVLNMDPNNAMARQGLIEANK